jgi:hypothetical protein
VKDNFKNQINIHLAICLFLFGTVSFAATQDLICGESIVSIDEGTLRMKVDYKLGDLEQSVDGYASKSTIKTLAGKVETFVSPSGFVLKKESQRTGAIDPSYTLETSSEKRVCEIPF